VCSTALVNVAESARSTGEEDSGTERCEFGNYRRMCERRPQLSRVVLSLVRSRFRSDPIWSLIDKLVFD
jgi:hypothetical protein